MAESRSEPSLKFNQGAGAFSAALQQPVNQRLADFFQQHDASQGADALYAQVAAGASPGQAELGEFLSRNPYSNPDQLKAALAESADRGWVTLTETGFSATQKALDFTDQLVEMFAAYTAEREAELDRIDLPRVVGLLVRLVESAQAVDVFSHKPTFTFSRNYEYQDKTPSLLWVRRHLITLGAYRDDCHIASWKDLGLPGQAWEALTFLWQDQAHTPVELAEQLTFRGFEEADYADALEGLIDEGWVEQKEGQYILTARGKEKRQQAEDKTNQYYMLAFDVLTEDELHELMTQIEMTTKALTPQEEAQSV